MYTKHKATSSNLKQILFFRQKYILTHPSYLSNIHQIHQIILFFSLLVFLALFDKNPLEVDAVFHRTAWIGIGSSPSVPSAASVAPTEITSPALEITWRCVFFWGGPWAREPTKTIWEK